MKKRLGPLAKPMYAKSGSTVNSAGNYTKPALRKSIFKKLKASGKYGKPGQVSANLMMAVAKEYKARGGGYTS